MDGILKYEHDQVIRINASGQEVGRLGPGALQCLEVHLAPASQSRAGFYSGRQDFLFHNKILV